MFVTRDNDFSASQAEREKLHTVLVAEIGGDEGTVVIVDDLAGAMRRLGAVREDLRTAFAQTVEAASGKIGQSALVFLTDLTPYGIDGLEISGFLVHVAVEDVVEAWGHRQRYCHGHPRLRVQRNAQRSGVRDLSRPARFAQRTRSLIR